MKTFLRNSPGPVKHTKLAKESDIHMKTTRSRICGINKEKILENAYISLFSASRSFDKVCRSVT